MSENDQRFLRVVREQMEQERAQLEADRDQRQRSTLRIDYWRNWTPEGQDSAVHARPAEPEPEPDPPRRSMTKTDYAKYLQSEHWKQLRRAAIRNSPSCFRCGISRELARRYYDQDLHVHHKRYNLWREDLRDLEVLCRRCHDIETNGNTMIPQAADYPSPELRQVVSEPPCEVVVYRSGFGHPVIRQAAGLGQLEDVRIYLRQVDLPRLIRALVVLERGRA